MKRSTINQHLKRAGKFFDNHHFVLPPWAHWSLEDCKAVFQGGLGWDLTDFGSGAYGDRGLMLYNLRNGNPMEPTKTYDEKKIMVNNDNTDNRFFEAIGRFSGIVKDEETWRLLVGDYHIFLNAGEERNS